MKMFHTHTARIRRWNRYPSMMTRWTSSNCGSKDKIPSALSKGTRQKLMIAMAVMRNYTVMIADEPFSGLDPRQIAVLKKELLRQKNGGKGVLLSSHLLDVVENVCDRYVILKKGKILASGNPDELAAEAGLPSDSSMEQVYLRLAGERE